MTRGQEIIREVENFFTEIRAKYPNITDDMLDSQGAIYYMNGNDGTDFDWNANQRCCVIVLWILKGGRIMIKKFYFPLIVSDYERDEDGYWSDETVKYDGKYADCYRSQIERKFDGYNDNDMVEYFGEHDSKTAKAKLQSMIWGFETVNGCLYGKVTITISEELTEEEKQAVKDYICGQNSDGLGEGFEQQAIRIEYGEEIFVSFWHRGDDYWIYDSDEFDSKIRNTL